MAPLNMLDIIGLRPVFVDSLGDDAVLLPDHCLLLIDSALDAEGVTRVVGQALASAADRLRSEPLPRL